MRFKSLAILFCVFLTQAAHAKALKLALNWKPEPQFGGFYAAQVEDIYQKKGLDIEVIPGGAGTPTAQVVGANQAEFGIVAAEELPLARERGSDIVALFAVYQNSPVSIVAHAEHGFKSLKDLFQSNSTLAVQRGLPYFLYLEKKLGKPKAKIVPTLGGITNFLSDSNFAQQGIATSEPFLIQKKGVKFTNFMVSDEGFNPYLTVLVARKSWVEKNPEVAKKVVEAVRDGWRTYLDRPSKTNKKMHELNPSMDDQTFQESADAQKQFIETSETKAHGLGRMTQERWATLITQLKSVGLIHKDLNAADLFQNL